MISGSSQRTIGRVQADGERVRQTSPERSIWRSLLARTANRWSRPFASDTSELAARKRLHASTERADDSERGERVGFAVVNVEQLID